MDPEATLNLIEEILATPGYLKDPDALEELDDHLVYLIEWLNTGGFCPAGSSRTMFLMLKSVQDQVTEAQKALN